MQAIEELDEHEMAATAGGNWMDDLAEAVNCAEVTMYRLTHPD